MKEFLKDWSQTFFQKKNLNFEIKISDQFVNHVHEPSVDMLEIPGQGRCYVYFAR